MREKDSQGELHSPFAALQAGKTGWNGKTAPLSPFTNMNVDVNGAMSATPNGDLPDITQL